MDVTEMVLSEEQENSLHAAIEQVTNIQEKLTAVLGVTTVIPPTGLLPSTATLGSSFQAHSIGILTRIYIGGVALDITELDLRNVFGAYGHIRSITLSIEPSTQKHKGYAFVEFTVPEGAFMAVEYLNGVHLGGKSLKVGRPNNFPTELPSDIPRPLKTRIYVANVHELVGETELKAVFEPFGKIKACVLVPDAYQRKHKGYGYIEYFDMKHAQQAISQMHDFELGGRNLKLCKTIVGGDLPEGMEQVRSQRKVSSKLQEVAEKISTTVTEPLSESPVIFMQNIAEIEEIDKEFDEEIREECKKFGQVQKLYIHTDSEAPPNEKVCIFVLFAGKDEADVAISVMNGRWFGGRQIEARKYSKSKFLSGIYNAK